MQFLLIYPSNKIGLLPLHLFMMMMFVEERLLFVSVVFNLFYRMNWFCQERVFVVLMDVGGVHGTRCG